MKSNLFAPALILGASLMLAHAAHAQSVSVVFENSTLNILPGATATFAGRITNTSLSTITITGDELITDSLFLTGDDTPFFDAIPAQGLVLDVGESFPFVGTFASLFDISVLAGAALDTTYTGRFRVLGNPNSAVLGVGEFQVVTSGVTVVPESNTLATGVLGLGLLVGRRIIARRKGAGGRASS